MWVKLILNKNVLCQFQFPDDFCSVVRGTALVPDDSTGFTSSAYTGPLDDTSCSVYEQQGTIFIRLVPF
jgi:hypothetical protein